MADPSMSQDAIAEDDLRPEYDFKSLRVVARGAERGGATDAASRPKSIELAPDLTEAFPDSESGNQALRMLLKLARSRVAPQVKLVGLLYSDQRDAGSTECPPLQ